MKPLFVTDLDGTLLNSSGSVSSFTAKTINRLIGEGMLFSVASARSVLSASDILAPLDLNLPGVFMNGVFLSNPWNKNTISAHFLDAKSAESLTDLFETGGRPPFVFSFLGEKICDSEYETKISVSFKELLTAHDREFYESRKNSYGMIKQASAFSCEHVIYVNGWHEKEKIQPIYEKVSKLPDVSCVFYEDVYTHEWLLECFSKKASKPARAAELKARCGADTLICFGDNYNDIPMLKKADIKIAVKNAVDEVLKMADYVIESNDNDGVARFLEDFWRTV